MKATFEQGLFAHSLALSSQQQLTTDSEHKTAIHTSIAMKVEKEDIDKILNSAIALVQEQSESQSISGQSFTHGSTDGESQLLNEDIEAHDGAKELRDTVIKREEKAVKTWRIIVGLAIAFCAISVTVAVYMIAKRSDELSFELEYEGIVKDIKALVRWEVRYNFALMEQLSASTTISAGYLNSSFPFHTESKFEISGGFVDGMGGIMSAAFAPLVTEDQRQAWETYAQNQQGWIEESAYLEKVHPTHRDALHGTIQDHEHDRQLQTDEAESISPTIFRWENGKKFPEDHYPGQILAPLWQVSPANYGIVNVNLLSDPRISTLYTAMLTANRGVMSSNFEVGDLFDFLFDPEEKQFKKDPHGFILQPVYDEISESGNIVGFFIGITPFGNLIDRLLPEGMDGVIGVLKDDCGNVMSYELSGSKALFLGYEDLHEPKFDRFVEIENNIEMYDQRFDGLCTHDLYIYPSTKMSDSYNTIRPKFYTSLVAFAFLLTMALFAVFDWAITRRQNKTIVTALQTQAIVTSLFPAEVGKRMIKEAQEKDKEPPLQQKGDFRFNNIVQSRDEPDRGNIRKANNLAQLYTETTVMFGDLVGFTAWSSVHEPTQVFHLLETLYAAFDAIANRRGVFKVETIGDCYVAVCGLPHPKKNHMVIMARFATDCLRAVRPLLLKLEVELGPQTSELGIRIGLNSGPVTAGVLRGDRARFQLFGDTVNTAARVEGTGSKNMIHVSKETADLLITRGKGHWLRPRKERVEAKGKGELQTYWLQIKNDASQSLCSDEDWAPVKEVVPDTVQLSESQKLGETTMPMKETTSTNHLDSSKELRLVDWMTTCLSSSLRAIASHRKTTGTQSDTLEDLKKAEQRLQENSESTFLDEVQDIIDFPNYDTKGAEHPDDVNSTEVDQVVTDQLRHYVTTIAATYRENSFHAFEHASHVTMSVSKLLSRIIAADHERSHDDKDKFGNTYGAIMSDPLTQFAVTLSALVHDVDHPGVPNDRLISEKATSALIYRGRSVAEQNSLNIAWNLLMQDSYKDLRQAIYCNQEELQRFRSVVVATVLATDIADKQLKELRNARWTKAFGENVAAVEEGSAFLNETSNRKVTIVIEHIIQASDIAHTMQHWHVYTKWNERLFREMYLAYRQGRSDKNPVDFWYKGEMFFFDCYIIPLAKKLKDCGVFGVSGDEYLRYARGNRQEWEEKGQSIVAEFAARASLDVE